MKSKFIGLGIGGAPLTASGNGIFFPGEYKNPCGKLRVMCIGTIRGRGERSDAKESAKSIGAISSLVHSYVHIAVAPGRRSLLSRKKYSEDSTTLQIRHATMHPHALSPTWRHLKK